MSPHGAPDARGVDRVWRLVADGFQIVDVDSDDLFVGVRMERRGDSVTLLLTRADFAALFPNADAGDGAPDLGAHGLLADR